MGGKDLKTDNYDSEFYICTTNIKFPMNEVVEKIHSYVKNNSETYFQDVYSYLREYYDVSSFNRRNLMRLIVEEFNVSNSGKISIKQPFPSRKTNRESFNSFEQLRDSVLNLKYYSSVEPDKSNVNKMLLELKNSLSIDSTEIDEENLLIKKAFGQYIKFAVSNNLSMYLNKLNKTKVQELYNHLLEEEKIKTDIRTCIENMHDDYREALLDRLLNPSDFYAFDKPTGTRISDLSKSEIKALTELASKNYEYALLLLEFDKSANESLVSAFTNAIREKTSDEKIGILILRGQGKTLDEIGIKNDVSRERIRQIEKKIVGGFINSINSKLKKHFFSLLKIVVKNPIYVSYLELQRLMGDYAFAFLNIFTSKYALERELRKLLTYEDINVLNLSNIDWYSEIEKKVILLDSIVTKEKINAFVLSFKRDLELANVNLPEEAFLKIILNRYRAFGNVYSTENLTVIDQYRLVIDEYFKNGIHIYSNESLTEFRRKHFLIFENPEIFDKENRAISARIFDVAIQIDRGTYCLEGNTPDLSNELASRIKKYIVEGPSIILTQRVFNQFEEELVENGVNNRYMLHAMLKRKFGDELYFKRDFISKKGPGYKVIDELEKYLNRYEGVISVDELNVLFPSTSSVTVLTYLSNNPDYIPNFNREWINIRDIKCSNDEIEVLRSVIKQLLKNKEIITAKHVAEETGLKLNSFFKRNHIEFPFFLFGILKSIFREEFKFERPFIANLDTVITKGPDRVKEFIDGFDQITISEITEYNREHDLKLYSILEFIRSINKEFLRVDEDLLVSIKALAISEDVLSSVRYILNKLLKEREAINLKKLKMSSLPYAGYPWNKYLMASIIETFLDEFEVVNTTNFYFSTEFIIVKNNNDQDRKSLIERYS